MFYICIYNKYLYKYVLYLYITHIYIQISIQICSISVYITNTYTNMLYICIYNKYIHKFVVKNDRQFPLWINRNRKGWAVLLQGRGRSWEGQWGAAQAGHRQGWGMLCSPGVTPPAAHSSLTALLQPNEPPTPFCCPGQLHAWLCFCSHGTFCNASSCLGAWQSADPFLKSHHETFLISIHLT